MITKFKTSIISLVALLALTGCSKKEKRGYVVFYVWGDTQEISFYEKIATSFEEETGIHVKVQYPASEYYNNLNIAFSSKNNAPDIFWTESGQFTSQIASGKLLDLTPYIESGALDVVTDTNLEGQIKLWDINDAYKYDGENYGEGDYFALIKDWSTDFVLWYNKDYIDTYNDQNFLDEDDPDYIKYPDEQIPMSWDEFMDISYRLQSIRHTNIINGTMLDRVPYKHVFEWIQMNGSSPWDESGRYFNYNDPKVVEAFQYFDDLQIGPTSSAPKCTDTAGSGSGSAFANGEIAFAFFGNWAYSSYNWDTVDFDFGLCPPPTPKAGTKASDTYAATASMVGMGVYKDSSMINESIQFLNYYMVEGQKMLASKGFNIPGNQLVAESTEFKSPSNKKLKYINSFFLNIAQKYSHTLDFNQYIPQETVEEKFGKYFSLHLNDSTGLTLKDVLLNVYQDLKEEL